MAGKPLRRTVLAALALVLAGGGASAQRTERVSVDSSGAQGFFDSVGVSLTADGRFAVFGSTSNTLVPHDVNARDDVFLHDRVTGATTLVSVDANGKQGNGHSRLDGVRMVSADGRYAGFTSLSNNLVPGVLGFGYGCYVKDLQTGAIVLANVDSAGKQSNMSSFLSAISADGRCAVFDTASSNLVSGDANTAFDVFVHDLQAGTTDCVSLDPSGNTGDKASGFGSISADGRFVAFDSLATNLVSGDTNGVRDVFVRDRQNGTTERVSVASGGTEGDGDSLNPCLSADGARVVFMSLADDLVAGDANGWCDVFVRDRATGTTARVSVDSAGGEADDQSGNCTISPDGRFVGFTSFADDLVSGDTNAKTDVFVHGPWLTLEADPAAVPAGATLTFTTWTGAPSGAALLVATGLNGTPLVLPLVPGTFDAAGVWLFSATVPSGLAGNVVDFTSLGIAPTGKAALSNPVVVAFQ